MILIAAGSNVPFCKVDSQQIVFSAFSALAAVAEPYQRSPLYETPAWPDPSDPAFINAVGAFRTDLPPKALLAALHAIEAGFGRIRRSQNAPRTLDLDLLAYDDLIVEGVGDELVLPHPRLHEREFVLAPLCDIAPDWRCPSKGVTARSMLEAIEVREARRIS